MAGSGRSPILFLQPSATPESPLNAAGRVAGTPATPAPRYSVRYLLIAAGLANVALGVVGILVPGMPATVFLLVAGWCFARSSPRLDRWLHEHPRLGPYLRMVRDRSMPVRARVTTILLIWAGISSSVLLRQDAPGWFAPTLIGAGLVGSAFVAAMRRKPSPARVQPAGPVLR